VFSTAYAWVSRRWTWPATIAVSYLVWLLAALLVLALPWMAAAWWLAAVCLVFATRFLPYPVAAPALPQLPKLDIAYRMLAGAALTLLVTSLANSAGTRISGLLAMFPIISATLAIFIHRSAGSDAVIVLLRGFVRGLYSLAAFCMALAFLPIDNVTTLFTIATVAALGVQAIAASINR